LAHIKVCAAGTGRGIVGRAAIGPYSPGPTSAAALSSSAGEPLPETRPGIALRATAGDVGREDAGMIAEVS